MASNPLMLDPRLLRRLHIPGAQPSMPQPGDANSTATLAPLPMPEAPSAPAVVPTPAAPQPAPAPSPVSNSNDQLMRAQGELKRLQTTGAGVDQIKNPIGRTLAKIGTGIESALLPGFAEQTPGTALHNQMLQMQQQGKVNEAQKNLQGEAQEAQTHALTDYTQQRPEIEQSKIDQRQQAVQDRVGQAAAARGQNVKWDENGMPTFEDDPTSQAYADHQALSAMHQATADKSAIQADIAKNHYIPGTPEFAEAQKKLAQVDKRLGVAMASLGLRAKGLQLREENQNANLYGVGADGKTLVNAPQFEDDEGDVVTGGLKGAATAIKQQGAVGTFKDLGGSIKRTQGLLDQLHNSGADLSDYRVVDALQGAEQNHGTLTTVLHSRMLKSGLTEPQVNAIAGLAALREQLGTLRAASKGTGSEGQTQRMLDAAPNAGDTKEIANRKMVELQATYDRLSPSIPTIGGGLSLNGKGGRHAGGASPAAVASSAGPKVGEVDSGYRFKGGDPKDQKNWEKVK